MAFFTKEEIRELTSKFPITIPENCAENEVQTSESTREFLKLLEDGAHLDTSILPIE